MCDAPVRHWSDYTIVWWNMAPLEGATSDTAIPKTLAGIFWQETLPHRHCIQGVNFVIKTLWDKYILVINSTKTYYAFHFIVIKIFRLFSRTLFMNNIRKYLYIFLSIVCVILQIPYLILKWKILIKTERKSLFGGATNWVRTMPSLHQMHRTGPHYKKRPPRKALEGKAFAKCVVIKTVIKITKEPNSVNRKCVLVRLSTGKDLVAYVPGIAHNLQEHKIVLCRVGRCRHVPGVKIRCVRGKYDLPHVDKM